MSFNLVALEKKIRDRLNAGDLASASQGAHNTVAPGDTQLGDGQLPVVVVYLISGTYSHAWSSTAESTAEALYEVAVYDARENGLVNLEAVYGLIFGDAKENGLTPTYGLHMWEVTGMTGVENCRLEAADFGTRHDPENLCYWQTFRVFATEA
jgi:hypothetical protein